MPKRFIPDFVRALTTIAKARAAASSSEIDNIAEEHHQQCYYLESVLSGVMQKNPTYPRQVRDYLERNGLILKTESQEYVLRSSVSDALAQLLSPMQVEELEKLM